MNSSVFETSFLSDGDAEVLMIGPVWHQGTGVVLENEIFFLLLLVAMHLFLIASCYY